MPRRRTDEPVQPAPIRGERLLFHLAQGVAIAFGAVGMVLLGRDLLVDLDQRSTDSRVGRRRLNVPETE